MKLEERRAGLLLRRGPSRGVRHEMQEETKREMEHGKCEKRIRRGSQGKADRIEGVGQFIPGRREWSGEGSGSSVMSSRGGPAEQKLPPSGLFGYRACDSLPPLQRPPSFPPRARHCHPSRSLRSQSTCRRKERPCRVPPTRHFNRQHSRYLLSLFSATSIFFFFFPTRVDRGAPKQEIRRGRTANFSEKRNRKGTRHGLDVVEVLVPRGFTAGT